MNTPQEILFSWASTLFALDSTFKLSRATIQFVITGSHSGVWRIEGASKTVHHGNGYADLTVELSSDTLFALSSGNITPQIAYITKSLRLEGDVSIALELHKIMHTISLPPDNNAPTDTIH